MSPTTDDFSRRRTRGWRVACLLGLLGCAVSLGACGGFLGSDPDPDPGERLYAEGVHALDAGDFLAAEDRFRSLAARCESGPRGRSALLALATLHLDLRNPRGRPDEAARLAAIHLNVPDASAAERSLARTLYLLSVYRGADPIEGPGDLEARPPAAPGPADTVDADGVTSDTAVAGDTAASSSVPVGSEPATPVPVTAATVVEDAFAAPFEPARRFAECGEGRVAWSGVPEYPGTPPSRWTAGDTVLIRDTGAAGRAAALQARVNELEAELARIRKVLSGGGGGGEVPRLRP